MDQKKADSPSIWLTMLWHVGVGLPWAWQRGASTSSEREHGWTAGAGLEWAVWQHVVFGVEYNYTKFNADRNQFPAGVPPPGTQVDDGGIDIQSVMTRLSFKFGGGRPEPMAAK